MPPKSPEAVPKTWMRLREFLRAHPDADPWRLGAALARAAHDGRDRCVRLLLADPRTDLAQYSETVLAAASTSCRVGTVRALLADPRLQRALPQGAVTRTLSVAIRRGNLELLRLLLADPRCDPAADGGEALEEAATYDPEEEGVDPAEAVRVLLADPRVDPAAYFRPRADDVQWPDDDPATIRLILTDPRLTGGVSFSVISPDEWAGCPEPAADLWDGPVARPEPEADPDGDPAARPKPCGLLSVRSARLPALIRRWRAEGRLIPLRLVAEGLAPLEAELALVRGAAAALAEAAPEAAAEGTASLLFLMLAGVVGEHAALQLRLARAEAEAEVV